jgi:hypothetical protein
MEHASATDPTAEESVGGTGTVAAVVQDPAALALRSLQSALEQADDLPIAERLVLLRKAEELVASMLEGLDGL